MFPIRLASRLLLPLLLLLLLLTAAGPGAAQTPEKTAAKPPVYVGLDAELSYAGSSSAQAIRMGMLIAMEEVNQAGGVLGGRPLQLMELDNKSLPARALENLKALAAQADLVAVFGGRFSPTFLEALPLIHQLKLPLLNAWAAADAIVDAGYTPNYVFRLSLRDSWAMPAMLNHAAKKGAKRVGLLLVNTGWGRGNHKAAEAYVASHPEINIVGTEWFNWTDKTFLDKVASLKRAGAQALVLVANFESSALIREMAALPEAERLPIVSHWSISGGNFAEEAGPALQQLDFSLVQSYSFIGATRPKAKQVLAAAQRLFGVTDARSMASAVGVAHAYDLTHILALAIARAGSTERAAIRDALEQVRNYDGLIKRYPQPFSPERHEALSPQEVFMARYAPDGAIVRIVDR